MAPKKSKTEDFLLMETRHVTKTASALFYGNGFIVSALPVWLYCRVQMMDPLTYVVLFLAFTILSTWLVATAYKKVKIALKHKISLKREMAVSKEVMNEASKKMSRAEKDERVRWKKNEVADNEATRFSIFYNNTLYLFLVLMFFYFWQAFHPAINYVLSVTLSSFLVAFLSTGA